MIRFVIIFCFLGAIAAQSALSQDFEDYTEIDSEVMGVNPDKEYIIIKAGENDGIEIGDGLIVHRDGDKVAEAQIIEVRPDVSAAEILNIEKEQIKELVESVIEKEKEIKEGDKILIVKKVKRPFKPHGQLPAGQVKKSKWTTILGYKGETPSAAPVETITPGSVTAYEPVMPERFEGTQEPTTVRINIGNEPGIAFFYALLVLREKGYSVIMSNRSEGLISATRPIELSLMKELWADATASIGHKIVALLQIRGSGNASELSISAFKEHTQKGKQIKLPITSESSDYNKLIELASKIKERAGR